MGESGGREDGVVDVDHAIGAVDPSRTWVGHAVERAMDRRADDVFVALCDIQALPTWHTCVDEVLDPPTVMAAGRSWTARMRLGDHRWQSRSTLVLHDLATRRFAYTSVAEGGDGSYVDWRWHVADRGDRCSVHVGFVLRSSHRWTAVLSESKQRRRLTGELARSLAQLEALAAPAVPRRVDTLTSAG
jgi:hypothetical protein